MIKPRIKIETVPNPDIRVYHVTTEISRYSIHNFWRPLHRDSSEKYLEEVGEIGTQLLNEVFALPGVNEVFIKPYELSVTKAGAFDWEDIEPGIIEALKKTFGEGVEEVEIIQSQMFYRETPKPEGVFPEDL